MKLVKITIATFEGDMPYPVVTHTFTGKTEKEARGYLEAHKKTDSFFAGCAKGKFQTITCRNVPQNPAGKGLLLLGAGVGVGAVAALLIRRGR